MERWDEASKYLASALNRDDFSSKQGGQKMQQKIFWPFCHSLLVRFPTSFREETVRPISGKSKHQLWLELCEIVTKHAPDIKSVKVDPIIRSAIRRFTDENGRLWTSLADYYIRLGCNSCWVLLIFFCEGGHLISELVGYSNWIQIYSTRFLGV